MNLSGSDHRGGVYTKVVDSGVAIKISSPVFPGGISCVAHTRAARRGLTLWCRDAETGRMASLPNILDWVLLVAAAWSVGRILDGLLPRGPHTEEKKAGSVTHGVTSSSIAG